MERIWVRFSKYDLNHWCALPSSLKSKFRHFHVEVGKNGKEFEMYKNVKCTHKAVVLSTKPIVIFDVLVAVASSDRNKDAVNVASKSVLLAADVIEFAI